MNKTSFLAALVAVTIIIPSCRKAPETMKISIFCDHIESVARQEKIPFAEAAKKIKEIGFEGADVRVFTKPEELKTLDSLGFAHSCVITDIDYSNPDQKELEDKTLDFMDKYGYDRLMLVAGFIPEGGFSQAEMDDARQRIAAFAARVTAKGYKILIEDYDHERSFTSNAERLDSLFAVSKDLGLVFDTGNFQFSGQDRSSSVSQTSVPPTDRAMFSAVIPFMFPPNTCAERRGSVPRTASGNPFRPARPPAA